MQYDISVRSPDGHLTVYRTLDIIADRGAKNLRSKGTRVWKAVRLDDGVPVGEPVALKDCWVETEGREADIIAKLLQSPLFVAMPDYARFFLTTDSHGDVFIDGKPETTAICSRMNKKQPPGYIKPDDELTELVPMFHFFHYRIAFKEIGESLNLCTSLATVFSVLADASIGTSGP